MKALFLDRDGVINRTYIDLTRKPKAPTKYHDFIFLPYVKQYLSEIYKLNYTIIIITNQPDITYGTLSKETLSRINAKIYNNLPVKEIFTCHHGRFDNCKCRKPQTMLFTNAIKKYHLSIKDSFTIGDRWSDIEASVSLGIKAIFIDRKYEEQKPIRQIYTTNSSKKALEYIIRNQ